MSIDEMEPAGTNLRNKPEFEASKIRCIMCTLWYGLNAYVIYILHVFKLSSDPAMCAVKEFV